MEVSGKVQQQNQKLQMSTRFPNTSNNKSNILKKKNTSPKHFKVKNASVFLSLRQKDFFITWGKGA